MPPLSRRDLLKTAAALVPASLGGCADDAGDGTVGGAALARFDHGVASGDPTADAVILWTRATPRDAGATRLPVDWLITSDPALREVVARGRATADAARDYTVKVDVAGLAPGTTYWYRFASGEVASPVGRTRTAPVGTVDRLRFAFVTCSDYSRGYYNVYRRVAERRDLQAVVHLGDYLYENGRQDGVRPQNPPRETVSLGDYRTRYATQRGDGDLQELHRQHPMIWVWDDHEVANNAWRDGAEAHDPATEGDYRDRRAAAFQAAHEWLPIRTPEARDLSRIYRRFRYGDLLDLLMIDARQVGRDQPADSLGGTGAGFRQTGAYADPARQMLGAEQERWLGEQLATSTARWRGIGNQVYFSPLKLLGAPRATNLSLFVSNDKWDGYEPARDRVLAMIEASRGNVVVMTGDAHETYAFDITPDPNSPNYDALTGDGSRAVEFVVTSTTSRGDAPVGDSISGLLERLQSGAENLLRLTNPHLKHFNNRLNGYALADITPARWQTEFWTVPLVSQPSREQALDAVWLTLDGSQRLSRGDGASAPMADAPPPAP